MTNVGSAVTPVLAFLRGFQMICIGKTAKILYRITRLISIAIDLYISVAKSSCFLLILS